MEMVFTGRTALDFYRTPPRVIQCLPSFPADPTHADKSRILDNQTLAGFTNSPFHVLEFNRVETTNSKMIKRHLVTGELPSGSIWEDEIIGHVTSPLFTLLMLAREISAVKLAMLMYEFCGGYAVFAPTEAAKSLLSLMENDGRFSEFDGWRRVGGESKFKSQLWMRKPLIEIDELKKFASDTKGIRGNKRFAQAAQLVCGLTRSPFETKTAILLSAPRKIGGQGLEIETNVPIRFEGKAKKLASSSYAEADISLPSSKFDLPILLECQGRAVHSINALNDNDANRTLALETMGYKVVLLTYEQIKYQERFAAFLQYLKNDLGVVMKQKSKRQLEKELDLHYELIAPDDLVGNEE